MSSYSNLEMSGVLDLSVINRRLHTILEEEEVSEQVHPGPPNASEDRKHSPVLLPRKPGEEAFPEFCMNPDNAEQILQDRLQEFYSSRMFLVSCWSTAVATLIFGPVISVSGCLLWVQWKTRRSIGKETQKESQNAFRMQFEAVKTGIGYGLVSSALLYVGIAIILGWHIWSLAVSHQSADPASSQSILSIQDSESFAITILALIAFLYFTVGLILIRSAACKLRELLTLNLPAKKVTGARVMTERSQTCTMTEIADSPIPL